MSLQAKVDALCHTAHELLHLGLDGSPIYSDHFRQLNADVYNQCEQLFTSQASTNEEEASLCIALLTGYNATIYNHGDKEEKIQSILNRSWEILDKLTASILKCRLLVACYAEVFDEELAVEAHAIINSWKGKDFVKEELDIVDYLRSLEESPYPCSEIED